jgi:quercetin dioxygenase-like cupin family protein
MMPGDEVVRRVLLTQAIPVKEVRTVVIREIKFSPGQKAGSHRHPCPVFGLIMSGEAVFQVEGQDEQVLHAGEAFYEPQGAHILHFDNASESDGMTFVAFYLIDRESQLIEML